MDSVITAVWFEECGDEVVSALVERQDVSIYRADFRDSTVTDAGLALIAKFSTLHYVYFHRCKCVTKAGIALLVNCKLLRGVTVLDCAAVPQDDFADLRKSFSREVRVRFE